MGKRKDDRQTDIAEDFDEEDFEVDELDDSFDSSSWDELEEDEDDDVASRRRTERRRKGGDWQEDFEEWSRYSDHDRW